MNYRKIYNKLIKYRQKHILEKTSNTEEHHIKPRCFFKVGTPDDIINNKDNLVRLTLREHFLVHALLIKMYKKGSNKWFKMSNVMNIMCDRNYVVTSRIYEKLKLDYWEEKNKNFKKDGLKKINEICNWIDKHNKYPKQNQLKNKEHKMALQIIFYKQLKHGKSDGNWYNEYQELVENRGYGDLFEYLDREKIGINTINKICDWMDKHKRKPSHSSKNKNESKLGVSLSNFKGNKDGQYGVWYKSYDELIEKRGYPNLFEKFNRKQDNINKINKLCDWMDKHKRKPSHKGNKEEVSLFTFISTMKYKKTKKGSLDKEYLSLIKKRNYPNIFNTVEDNGLIRVKYLCDVLDKYNGNINNIKEKHKRMLRTFKDAKNGIQGKWYKSYENLFNKRCYNTLI